MSFRLRLPALVLAVAAAAGAARGQVVTWGGGFPDDLSGTASNWSGGVLPLNDGTETLQFTDQSSNEFDLSFPAFFSSVTILSTGSSAASVAIGGGSPLHVGAGGIYVQGIFSTASSLTINAPVVLEANQIWGIGEAVGGTLTVNGAVSGSFSLTLHGDDTIDTFTLGSSASTFNGGLTFTGENATLILSTGSIGPAGAPTSGPAGTGTLSLGDGTLLTTPGTGTITIANPIVIGDQSGDSTVTFGGSIFASDPPQTVLTLTGPVTLNDPDTNIELASNAWVTFGGSLTGYVPTVCLDFVNSGFGGNSVAVLQGNISNVNRFDLESGVSVIFDAPSGLLTSGTSQISTLSDIGGESASDYVGLGAGYASTPGYVSAFINFMNSSGSAGNFAGTFGFDTTSGPTATFSDPVDLTNFTEPGFEGLGSTTTAILGASAVITPPGGVDGTVFPFGSGGGTLTVLSPLGDGTSSRSVQVASGGTPLTLVLGGTLTYTGGTSVFNGALIFDTPLPASGSLNLGEGPTLPGYIGSTANSGYSDTNTNIQNFIDRFSGGDGVIGFDVIGGSVRTVTSNVDLSDLNSDIFLGTATAADFSGTINPEGNTYRFAGVKGGQVTISSVLSGPTRSAVIGLDTTLEAYNPSLGFETISSVTLSNPGNSYGGGTQLNSGYLYVTNSNSIGTGTLTVPDSTDFRRTGWVANLATFGAPVVLSNPIQVPDGGLALNNGALFALTLTGDISSFGTDAGSLGIFGPVNILGNNTYSGGTTVGPTTLIVTSSTGLGTGSLVASGSTITFAAASTTLASAMFSQVSLNGTNATFAGTAVINDLSMAQSSLTFAGATATINGFESDAPGSSNFINLGSGTTLTFNTQNPNSLSNSADYHGTITGIAGSNLFVTGAGSLQLVGIGTYPGGTVVDNNTVLIVSNSSALGTGPVALNPAAVLATNLGVTLTNPITFNTGSVLAGYGTYSPGGTLFFSNGVGVDPGRANISAGNGGGLIPVPGKLSFGAGTSVNFAQTGLFEFSLADASGTAGTGYGTVSMTGSPLTISATPGSPFMIDLFTFDPATNLPGFAVNFNPNISYTWTLVSAQSISGFSAAKFDILGTNFQNATNGGTFSVGISGNDLTLNFTPVPEPSTWALMAAGLFAFGGAALRRRRR